MKQFLKRHREFIAYAGFGCGTVALNFSGYYICYYKLGISNVAANVAAWMISVAFAFVTNKWFVFESRSFHPEVVFREAAAFFSGRAMTGVLDVMMMYETVDCLKMDGMMMKCFVDVIVIALNYIISKKIAFREEHYEKAVAK